MFDIAENVPPPPDLRLALSIAAIVAREAVGLTTTANRLIAQTDQLMKDCLARARDLGHVELAELAETIGRQHELMSALCQNALAAVGLATKQLTGAVERSRSGAADPHGDAECDQRSAARLLEALANLERAVRRSERQLHDVKESVGRMADRAARHVVAAQTYSSLIGRLLGRDRR